MKPRIAGFFICYAIIHSITRSAVMKYIHTFTVVDPDTLETSEQKIDVRKVGTIHHPKKKEALADKQRYHVCRFDMEDGSVITVVGDFKNDLAPRVGWKIL